MSPIDVDRLGFELQKHPDRHFVEYLLSGLRFGFDTMVSTLDLPIIECKNLLSAVRDPETVDSLIEQEVQKGYIKGPFDAPPFSVYRVSPIGIAEGKYSGKKRLILDLSSPHNDAVHSSINDLIDKESCSLSYVKIDDAISAIKHCGKHAILNKTDITDAFKQLGIRRDQHHLYCMKWKGLYYYYVRLCFGSRSSPCIFDTLSQAVCWIAQTNYGIRIILHLLDDFLTIQSPETCGFRTMAILTVIFNRLKIPISKKKTVGPTTTLEYLGIILDTDLFEARLPEAKIERIVTFIQSSIERKSVRKRELLQLLGHFNFAARIIRPGRSFVSHLISLSTKVDKLHHFITLSKECREDLRMWSTFLSGWNRISFFYDDQITVAGDMELFTDAASNFGFGGYFQRKWFSSEWPLELASSLESNWSMAFRELYPIVVAAYLWGHLWCRKRIMFHCDNEAVVNIVNKGRSKMADIMKLMRTLTWLSVRNNFIIHCKHIPGVKNVIADALSRFNFQTFRAAAPAAEEHPTPCPPYCKIIWN